MMKVILIHPPCCDPTSPYLALPMLASVLRNNGFETELVDANLEGFLALLNEPALAQNLARTQKRWRTLNHTSQLNHHEQLEYLTLKEIFTALPRSSNITQALEALTSYSAGFLDPQVYDKALETIDWALAIISAAYHPLSIDFTQYRTPFTLLSLEEIEREATPTRNPFAAYYEELAQRIKCSAAKTLVVGISFVFPGQLQPGFALALKLRRSYPDLFLLAGGPALTQLLIRHPQPKQSSLLGPFNTAILFEGEEALLKLLEDLSAGQKPAPILYGAPLPALDALPAPDFEGLPLSSYLAPEIVLPYDPSRGCYWRKCAFCHYGLAEQGAARYRERPASTVAFHLLSLQKKYQHRLFYFSHDTLAPRFAREIALKLQAAQADFRWSSDIRPEPAFTADCCHTLRQGGALSFSLGMESASPRILKRMEKGIQQDSMLEVMRHLKTADIAAEAMCFTDFPTETRDEALMTIKALEKLKPALSLFICGEFGLMHGAKVALDPPRYGLAETWHVSGDDLHTTLFYREQKPSKSEQDRALINAAIAKLAQHYWLHGYPWAGSLSTAHTLIHYLHLGRDAFKIQAQKRLVSHRPFSTHLDEGSVQGRALQFRPRLPEKARFRLDEEEVQMNESLIWDQLVNQRRTVSRELYHELAQKLPNKKPFRRLRRQR